MTKPPRIAAEQAARPKKIHSLLENLSHKSDDELLELTFEPCLEVDCQGLPSDVARQAVNLVRSEKQNQVDLEVRKTQAHAAEVSAAIAGLTLVIAIISLIISLIRSWRQPQPQKS
jgi:hypothetical protein